MRGRLMRTAATASMVSSARRNRAERKAINANSAKPDESTPADSSLTQQLSELSALKDKGILTQEEFDAKKKQILGI